MDEKDLVGKGLDELEKRIGGLGKTIENLKSESDTYEYLLIGLLGCGSRDLECIVDMEKNHDGTVERAKELFEEIGGTPKVNMGMLNFGHFVMAVKDRSLDEIEDEFKEIFDEEDYAQEHINSFGDMVIDDNYCAWGGIANYGSYEGDDKDKNREFQEIFAEYVTTGDKEEFIKRCRECL